MDKKLIQPQHRAFPLKILRAASVAWGKSRGLSPRIRASGEAILIAVAGLFDRVSPLVQRRRERISLLVIRPLLTIAICCLAGAGSVAQESESSVPPSAPSATARSQTTTKPANTLQSGMALVQVLQRKSLVFPDLATSAGRLDSWQKFELAANNSVSLSTIGAALLGAGYGQAINRPAGYGQGGEGYGKRFGANMARAASDNMFGAFLIASVLHEDSRFYVRKQLSFKESVRYSAVRVFYTRSDSGEKVVNFAGLLGPVVGEALANTYYPEGSRGVSSILIRYASDLGWRFGGNLLRQYWPSINKKLRLQPAASESATAP
jgi:hypothetical protein